MDQIITVQGPASDTRTTARPAVKIVHSFMKLLYVIRGGGITKVLPDATAQKSKNTGRYMSKQVHQLNLIDSPTEIVQQSCMTPQSVSLGNICLKQLNAP